MNATALPAAEETHTIPESEVRAQLERVLNEHPLRNSNRCRKFLSFIVEKTLQGEGRDIKERIIGVEVFGRALNYDPANDPVVRLVAGETRKRIAQYYVQRQHEHELRIDVLPGTYVPNFHWPESGQTAPPAGKTLHELASFAPEAQLPPHLHVGESTPSRPAPGRNDTSAMVHPRPRAILLISAVVAVVILVAAASAWWVRTAPSRALREFWHPLLTNGGSTLICIGDLNSPSNPLPSDDDSLQQIQQTRNHVGPYDVGALARLAGMLGGMGRPFKVMLADNTNLTDFRSQPAILIGAFDNQWTSLVLSNQRFHFQSDPATGTVFLMDAKNPKNLAWSLNVHQPMRAITRDTALVSRVVSTTTGNVELVIAGIGPYGTSAASEYVTDPEYFKEFTDRAPKDWKDHDTQIVISTDVVNGRSGPPHMLMFEVR